MSRGLIFSIEEFAVYDGPGMRVVVFFKGCPLRCNWCHNPEGLSFKQEIVHSPNGCQHCGKCSEICSSPDDCVLCLSCTKVCQNNLIRVSGKYWDSDDLIRKLNSYKNFFNPGGLTFSGGEVLAQPEFLYDLLVGTRGIHRAIETSGFADEEVFRKISEECDLVMMDIKAVRDDIHKRYTGVSNQKILNNLEVLKTSGKRFIIRVPLIPGVNDTEENFSGLAALLKDAKERCTVEVLPYNKMAGAKYAMVGKTYRPEFPSDREPERHFEPLDEAGISWKVL